MSENSASRVCNQKSLYHLRLLMTPIEVANSHIFREADEQALSSIHYRIRKFKDKHNVLYWKIIYILTFTNGGVLIFVCIPSHGFRQASLNYIEPTYKEGRR